MLRSIIERAVASEPDLQLAKGDDGDDVDSALERSGADVLIVEERLDRTEAFYRALLLKHPSLKVFILTQGGRNLTLVAFRRVRLVDTSPTTLIEAIRAELEHQLPDDEG